MAKQNRSPGVGSRYDQPDAIEEKTRQQSTRHGVFLSFICPVCGKRRQGYKHNKCSKILQKQRNEDELRQNHDNKP